MKTALIIPAAGRGRRMRNDINKQYLLLSGKPVLAHTLSACLESACFEKVIVVVAPGEEGLFRREVLLPFFDGLALDVAAGGAQRQESVYNALQVLSPDYEYVCVHDGARPLAKPSLFKECLDKALTSGAAVAAIEVKDTIKQIDQAGVVTGTLLREFLRAAQTPQIFRRDWLEDSHRRAAASGFYCGDDAGLLEYCGYPVSTVKGDFENLKITTPVDFLVAENILRGRGVCVSG